MKKIFTLLSSALLVVSVNAQLIVATGSTAVPRMWHSSQTLANGKVVTFGGDNGNAMSPVYYSSAELYNNGSWSSTGSMSQVRDKVCSILLTNGDVLAIGGQDASSNVTLTCEIYSVASGTWSLTGSTTNGRKRSKVVMLNNGKVLVAGGEYTSTCELYDQTSGTWTLTGSLNGRDNGFTLTKLPNGNVLATGGNNQSTAEIYDVATGVWTNVATNMSVARSYHQAILMTNNKVLIAGGDYQLTAEIFDPAANTFSAAGTFTQYISECPMVNLPNGKVLVFGIGDLFNSTDRGALQVYAPAANNWYSAGVVPVSIFTAAVYTVHTLQNGKILYVDGNFSTGNGSSNHCNLVDPAFVAVGVEEQTELSMLSVYPNPVSNFVTINVEVAQDGNISVQLFDLLGNQVMEIAEESRNKQFQSNMNIEALPAGVYFLTITSGNSISTRKIIKE